MKTSPKYVQVREELLNQILHGELKPGDKLHSEDYYAKLFDVSSITVRKALSYLVEDGYIKRIKSKGTFVKEPEEEEAKASKLVALLLSPEDYYGSSYMQIIRGIQKKMAENGYSLIVEWVDRDAASERSTIVRMLDRKVEGLLIYPYAPSSSAENYEMIQQAGIPYILLDRHALHSRGYWVGCDNNEGGARATQALLEKGHSNIFFATTDHQFALSAARERFDGYCSAMRQAGIQVNENHMIRYDNDCSELRGRILAREITALFCSNDKLAIKIVNQLTGCGIRIPDDLSVIGFDDWAGASDSAVPLTTIRQDFHRIGSTAAQLLVMLIGGAIEAESLKLMVGTSLIERESVAAPPV